jgi:hypothetical protein
VRHAGPAESACHAGCTFSPTQCSEHTSGRRCLRPLQTLARRHSSVVTRSDACSATGRQGSACVIAEGGRASRASEASSVREKKDRGSDTMCACGLVGWVRGAKSGTERREGPRGAREERERVLRVSQRGAGETSGRRWESRGPAAHGPSLRTCAWLARGQEQAAQQGLGVKGAVQNGAAAELRLACGV